jgi:hypothetical protein
MEITKEQFNEYKEVQEMGAYNMFDSRARELTKLSKSEWIYIMKNYEELDKLYMPLLYSYLNKTK